VIKPALQAGCGSPEFGSVVFASGGWYIPNWGTELRNVAWPTVQTDS